MNFDAIAQFANRAIRPWTFASIHSRFSFTVLRVSPSAKRGLALLVLANTVSMIGSGMNSAALFWHILQTTHSELSLGLLVVLQTIPAMMLMPFSGVVIDREDRRRLVMALDSARATVIFVVAFLVLRHHDRLWHLYAMYIVVSAGFWMFWPTVTALVQELTPKAEFVHANTLIMAGVQGGWLIAGAFVGFVYNRIGLGGVLLLDCATYVFSLSCYALVRKGRYVVARSDEPAAQLEAHAVSNFVQDLREGLRYVRSSRTLILLGVTWACFVGAMFTQGVITAPVSDRILHAGAVGYGWMNGAWGAGAFISALVVGRALKHLGPHRLIAACLACMGVSLCVFPFSRFLALACACYFIGGIARAAGGIALSSEIMTLVPKHLMGRTQNTFALLATSFQIVLAPAVGVVAHRWSLSGAIVLISGLYFTGFVAAASISPASRADVSFEAATEPS
jgi:MFS family permease